jgi:poly(ADP-ribose) glycohydrolase ARH3
MLATTTEKPTELAPWVSLFCIVATIHMTAASPPSLSDRFHGCLLGLAVADALAAPFEALDGYAIYQAFGPAANILKNPPQPQLVYTDDTEMAIGVCECLVEHGHIDSDSLAALFARNYTPGRGYGPGAARIIEGVRAGRSWRELTRSVYPDGSFGNGAAMRVAPVGLWFHDDLDRVADEARLSASVTHEHALGIDGAVVMATAIALLAQGDEFEHAKFCSALASRAQTEEFRWQLQAASRLTSDNSIPFGNGIEAHRSVVTAICCFSLAHTRYEQAIARALSLGGDVDTIAAMAGALSGTHLGVDAVPNALVARMRPESKGVDHLRWLASQLATRRALA